MSKRRTRKTVVLREHRTLGAVDSWERIDRAEDFKEPKTPSQAEAWVRKGRYGEGTFLVLSTVVEPITVRKTTVEVFTDEPEVDDEG